MFNKCWICGHDNLTGEHSIKASDMRAEFKLPVYKHTDNKINQKIQGVNSKLLKSEGKICAKCNNDLTQPHDLAWNKMSSFFRGQKEQLKSGDHIKLHKIFPGEVHAQMLNVHLFFVKWIGCAIKEVNPSADLTSFAKSILENRSLSDLYIKFIPNKKMPVGCSDLNITWLDKNKFVYAYRSYIVSSVIVDVHFATPNKINNICLGGAWHPKRIKKRIIVGNSTKSENKIIG